MYVTTYLWGKLHLEAGWRLQAERFAQGRRVHGMMQA